MSKKIEFTSENVEIPPYICKKFKLIPLYKQDNIIYFDYVNEVIDENSLEQIKFILDKNEISFSNKITEKEYITKFKKLYPDVVIEKTELEKNIVVEPTTKKEEIDTSKELPINKLKNPATYSEEKNDVMDFDDFIKEISTEFLEKELRKRYLSKELIGTIIYDNNEIKFNLDNMTWPSGAYRVKISFEEDITDKYIEAKQKQNEGPSLRKENS